ncbi:hypothetical protein Fcan01_00825, partial [Folsomia candida]
VASFVQYISPVISGGMQGYSIVKVKIAIGTGHNAMTASVSGFCGTNETPNIEALSFEWSPDPRQPEVKHSVTLTFQRYSHLKKPSFLELYYAVTTIHGRIQTNEVDLHDPFDPEHIYNLTASDVGAILSAPEKLSFVCKSIQLIKFNDGRNSFAMSEVHVEAFHDKIALGDGKDFGPK